LKWHSPRRELLNILERLPWSGYHFVDSRADN
jgi:hypothetical protein